MNTFGRELRASCQILRRWSMLWSDFDVCSPFPVSLFEVERSGHAGKLLVDVLERRETFAVSNFCALVTPDGDSVDVEWLGIGNFVVVSTGAGEFLDAPIREPMDFVEYGHEEKLFRPGTIRLRSIGELLEAFYRESGG